MKLLTLISFFFVIFSAGAQAKLRGQVLLNKEPLRYALVKMNNGTDYQRTNEFGEFQFDLVLEGEVTLEISSFESETFIDRYSVVQDTFLTIQVLSITQEMSEMVVSGNLQSISKMESTVNVEVYSSSHFKKNPTPTIFDALQNVNGVRPQLNCNVCNTGDIHINGLEGPYTMILIDGMPIVSNLGSVYGLSGIPSSLIDRLEIIKGPASSLYGSEAIGGILNVITKDPKNSPIVSLDISSTSWLEGNIDLAIKSKTGTKSNLLTGINYFNYSIPFDKNNDGFTDITLQNRISIFNKWKRTLSNNKSLQIAGRYLYEDRWGGQTNWSKEHRGTDSIYAESIYTNRGELLFRYELPGQENFVLSSSLNYHSQDSYYGTTSFQAKQYIAFGQLHWSKKIGQHDLLSGANIRYLYYDDNTVVTQFEESTFYLNQPQNSFIPGVFIQDEWSLSKRNKLLLGIRYDYHSVHKSIITPRIGFKSQLNKTSLRLNAGTGFRTVNVFTEDHAALTGARSVIIKEKLRPESSYNLNLNMYRKQKLMIGVLSLDFSAFGTYFQNRIIADYDSDPDLIVYSNSKSYALNYGINGRISWISERLSIEIASTYAENLIPTTNGYDQQILTEKYSGNWSVGYFWKKAKLKIDYTGNIYSPMRLPLLSSTDPRPEYSPWWSIQNIQLTFKGFKRIELYGGVKNLLNWTPAKRTDNLIARSHDPFDKNVIFDADGNALQTPENPFGLTFDPSYVYAPNQGIRGFIGLRLTIDQPK